MNEQLKNLKDYQKQLEDAIGEFGSIGKMAELTQDILPKDKFHAQIDGHKMEISIGLSGKAIVFLFQDEIKCASLFSELKSNKQGFFQRIFKTK